jgi:hypothetical protein
MRRQWLVHAMRRRLSVHARHRHQKAGRVLAGMALVWMALAWKVLALKAPVRAYSRQLCPRRRTP